MYLIILLDASILHISIVPIILTLKDYIGSVILSISSREKLRRGDFIHKKIVYYISVEADFPTRSENQLQLK